MSESLTAAPKPDHFSPVDALNNVNFEFAGVHYAPRTDEKMREVLLHPKAKGPAVHYHMVRGAGNVTIWEPGVVKDEFIKTYGHVHVGQISETYEILHGEGYAVLQRYATDQQGKMIADEVEDVKIIPVKVGDSIFMPPGWGHLLVNTGVDYFVTIDDSPVWFGEKPDEASMPGHADYEIVKEARGFAYYIVQGSDGQPALVRNKKYKEIRSQDLGGLRVVEDYKYDDA